MPKQFLDPQGLSQFTENLEHSIVADEYDSSGAYALKDYCVHENLLYRCTTAIPSGESWDPSHWVQILIMGDLKSKTQIRNVTTAEYEALSPEEKATGDFVITDPEMYPLTANTVPYDNSQSGSSATNVQTALDSILDFEHTKTGSLVSFDNGGNNIPVKSLIVKITAQQGGSGTPSPSNVRPIYGYDSADIHIDGLNIFDKSLIERDHNLVWLTGSLGTETGSWTSNYILVKPGTTYRANKTLGELFAYDINKTTVYVWKGGWLDVGVTGTDCNIAFTIPEGISYIRFARRNSVTGGAIDSDVANFQLEIGSTITAYNSYKGTPISFDFGSTVYDGTLNVTNGILTGTHQILDLGDFTWYYSSTQLRFYASIGNYDIFPHAVGTIADLVCDSYNNVPYLSVTSDTTLNNVIAGIYTNLDYITVRDTRYERSVDFQAAAVGIKIKVPLATPVVIQLTPTEVKTLLGKNNIYANTGDVALDYFTPASEPNYNLIQAATNKYGICDLLFSGDLTADSGPLYIPDGYLLYIIFGADNVDGHSHYSQSMTVPNAFIPVTDTTAASSQYYLGFPNVGVFPDYPTFFITKTQGKVKILNSGSDSGETHVSIFKIYGVIKLY